MSAILPAGTAVPRLGPYRVADYDRLPDEPRYELVFGRFHLTPSPFPRHQVVVPLLWQHFDRIAKAAGGFVFTAPLDVVLASGRRKVPVSKDPRGPSGLDEALAAAGCQAAALAARPLRRGTPRRSRHEREAERALRRRFACSLEISQRVP